MPSAPPHRRASRSVGLCTALVAVAVLLAAFPAAALGTHNDNYANRQLLNIGTSASHSNSGASVQLDEAMTPSGDGYCNNGRYSDTPGVEMAATLWYEVEGTGGPITISTWPTNFDTVVAVYKDGQFPPLGCDDNGNDFGNGESELVFNSQVGSTYQIQVGGKYNRPADTVVVGTIGLWIYGAPANDARGAAQTVQTGTATPSHNFGATMAGGEQSTCGSAPFGKTVWFRWTAPATGDAVFAANSTGPDTVLTAYPAGSGSPLGCSDDAPNSGTSSRLPARVQGGQTYEIQVGGFGAGQSADFGGFSFAVEFAADTDLDDDGSSPPADCNDNNGSIKPGAPDVNNGVDDDCDGVIDPDRDGDTYKRPPLGSDCDDGNPRIHPGATDIRGNRVNEDCKGLPAPFRRIKANLDPVGRHRGALTVLTSLVLQNVPKGAKINVRCFGPGAGRKPTCGSQARRAATTGVVGRAARNVALRGFRRVLSPGSVIEVRATKRAHIGFFQTVTMKATGAPVRSRPKCMYPGSRRVRSRCSGIR